MEKEATRGEMGDKMESGGIRGWNSKFLIAKSLHIHSFKNITAKYIDKFLKI